MKRLVLLTMFCFAFVISCNSDENIEAIAEKESITQQKSETLEGTAFVTKVAAVFNKMIQHEEVFSQIKIIIEEDLVMRTEATIKDDIMMGKYGIFEDDIMLNVETIKDDLVMGKTTLDTFFKETFEELFSESVSLEAALEVLPKLHIGFPKVAFENYDFWKENGFAISIEAYDNTNNSLKKVSEKELLNFLGEENYSLFMKSISSDYNTFYIDTDAVLKRALATNDKKGNIITVEKETVTIGDFEISDEGNLNTISILLEETLTTYSQLGKIHQTYVDIFVPNPCNGFYVFKCNSIALENYLNERQQLANETCETLWACLPICCNGGIMYVTYWFEPTPLKCKKIQPYLSTLSDYSLLVSN